MIIKDIIFHRANKILHEKTRIEAKKNVRTGASNFSKMNQIPRTNDMSTKYSCKIRKNRLASNLQSKKQTWRNGRSSYPEILGAMPRIIEDRGIGPTEMSRAKTWSIGVFSRFTGHKSSGKKIRWDERRRKTPTVKRAIAREK